MSSFLPTNCVDDSFHVSFGQSYDNGQNYVVNDVFFKNGPTPASFCLFLFFSNTNFAEKTVGVSGI